MMRISHYAPKDGPSPQAAASPYWRRGLVLAAALWLIILPATLMAQRALPAPSTAKDPYQDILIEGIGFSKLILQVERDGAPEDAMIYKRFMLVLERNLCWSGLFKLHQGKTKHCTTGGEPSRVDMRINFRQFGNGLRVRLQDAGEEGLVLFEQVVNMDVPITEPTVIDLVNAMARRITGHRGLLGSTIAFVLRKPGYPKVIVATTTHGRKVKVISTNKDISLLPHWSPDGGALVYTVLGRNGTGVYYHNLVQPAAAGRSSKFLTAESGLNSGGAFSLTGEKVAFTMSRAGVADLFEYDFKKAALRQLTFRDGIETSANWSPKTNELVFVSDRSGTPQIYLLDLRTGEDLRLTFDSHYNADPKWSPDGESILFTKRVNGRDQIHIMDKYGERVRAVTTGRYDAEQAEWSPDGKQIAFTSNRTGEFKLYVVSTDGSGLRRLTTTPDILEETSPSWTERRFNW